MSISFEALRFMVCLESQPSMQPQLFLGCSSVLNSLSESGPCQVSGTQHLSLSRWFSFLYTFETGIFFCTKEDWQVFANIIKWVGPASVPQKSMASLMISHTQVLCNILYFIYFCVPYTVLSKKTMGGAASSLYHPSACGVIRTTRAARSHDSQSSVLGLGAQMVKLSMWNNCFMSSLKNFIWKMARLPFLLLQCLLSLTWVLLYKYSFVPLARSFISLTCTLTSGALQKLPVKVPVGGELKQIGLCSWGWKREG